MKKVLILFWLALVSILLLINSVRLLIISSNNSTGSDIVNANVNNEEEYELEENSDRFVFIDAQYTRGLHIGRYYDKETKVIYMFTRNGSGGGLTVMVDAQGKPLLYDE